MACFIVPLAQAVATTVYRNRTASTNRNTFLIRNVGSLEKMLWGGSLMLVIDHILNGELIGSFPFFTALQTQGGGWTMLQEMLTVGLPMSLIVTLVWLVLCLAKEHHPARV